MELKRSAEECRETTASESVWRLATLNMHLVRAEQREAWLEATAQAQLDVCAVVETFLDGEGERVLEYELKDSQFQWFGKVERTLVGRRGVGMLVRRSLNPRIAKTSVSADLLWIVVGDKENPLYVAVVYLVPPTSRANREKNDKLLDELQADVVLWQGKVVVMGDWNSRVGCLPNIVVKKFGSLRREVVWTRQSVIKGPV